jgi:acetyl-CoA synthetase
MAWDVIRKPSPVGGVAPNLTDYAQTCAAFSWEAARGLLDGLPDGAGMNIAHEAVDRHAAGPRADHPALRFLGRDGLSTTLTYRDLREQTNRFANVLAGHGVGKGDRVFSLLGRCPELYLALLGTLKRTSVFSPLFSAFGPEPVAQRLLLGDGQVLVTTTGFYRRKVAPVRERLPQLKHVLVVDSAGAPPDGTLDLASLMAAASPDFVIPPTAPEDPPLLHFTSGTTGTPKGALHVHEAVVAHHLTGRLALDLHPEDVFWCTADPGWVTGTSYGVISPLTNGVTAVVDTEEMDVERWHHILASEQVSVWYTAPTALKMLKKAGQRPPGLPHLRFIASVGEPLNPEIVVWTLDTYGLPAHDNWWQTETGGIMIANFAALDIRPGSMGCPMPGITAAVVEHSDDGPVLRDGHLVLVEKAGEQGELVLRPGWPSMFRAYLHDEARYARCFVDGWYLTGDLVRRDADGWFWFVGRDDDVIKSAGHLIGPFEVESALLEHPAVAEAGVVGKPDPLAGELVTAFVTLLPAYSPSDELRLELLGFSRKRLGAAVAPREITFVDDLPKTTSGKILRRDLRARESGREGAVT